jgi:hypothetical protein
MSFLSVRRANRIVSILFMWAILMTFHASGPPSSANYVEGDGYPLTQQKKSHPKTRPILDSSLFGMVMILYINGPDNLFDEI